MKTDKILLDHGSGGKMSHRLIGEIMLPIFDNPILSALNDGAIFDIKGNLLAFSTDTYVVDPIYIANEGKLLAFVEPDHTEAVLKAIREDDFGKDATVIGEVVSDYPGKVVMQTSIGGTRIIDMLTGDQLPRIC